MSENSLNAVGKRPAPPRDRKTPVYQRLPVTCALVLYFGIFVVAPAVLLGNDHTAFVISLVAAAVGTSLLVELIFARRAGFGKPAQGPSVRASGLIFAVGILATVLASLGGRRSYAAQVGLSEKASWLAVVTPLTYWLLYGLFFLLIAHQRAEVRRRRMLLLAYAACVLQFMLGLRAGLVGSAASFTVTVLLLMVIVGFIRPRQFIALGLLLLLAWPLIQTWRDSVRADSVGVSAIGGGSAFDRLRLDQEMDHAIIIRDSPVSITPPSWLTVIRTGVLPSVLDSARPPIDTGSRMSVALGGSPQNSTSATFLGNVWLFDGWGGVVVVYGLIAFSFRRLLQSGTALSLSVAGGIYLSTMSLSASYPDGIVRILQGIVSLAGAALLAKLVDMPSRKNA